MATVSLPQILGERMNDCKKLTCTGATVGQCLDNLIEMHPWTRDEILDPRGGLLPRWHLFINNRLIHENEMTEAVSADDKIELILTISGG